MVTGPRRPNRDSPPQTVSRPFTGNSPGRLRLAMKLSAAHQPSCYVGRLQQRALGRKMGSQIPRDGNKNMTALVCDCQPPGQALSVARPLRVLWRIVLRRGPPENRVKARLLRCGG